MKHVFVVLWRGMIALKKRAAKFIREYPRVSRLVGISLLIALLAPLIFVVLVWMGTFGSIPDRAELSAINNQVATEIYSADSVLLGRYYLQERSPIPARQIPEGLRQALIATEDARFYEHSGIDFTSLMRVAVKSVALQHEASGGGSTLTQQLAKNLFPRNSYRWLSMPINKVKEMIIARRLEKLYTKEEILALYLNTIPFGDNVYGIKTAAERFFSKPVQALTIEESAVLVGMLKATYRYNPRIYPERSKQRRDVVIAQMARYDFITDEQSNALRSKPLVLNYQRLSHNEGLAPYFRSYIRSELITWCKQNRKPDGTPYNLYTDGLKVYTTIDSKLQRYAEEAVRSQMIAIQKKFEGQLNKRTLNEVAKSQVKQLTAYREMKAAGLSEQKILEALKELGTRRVFDWNGEKEQSISAYDSLLHHLKFLQAGLLAVDPQSGAVRAWVGGIDHSYFKFDHVRPSTKRQVGSTFKPIVYAAAIEQGISPCDYVSARKTSYSNMEDWTPENTSEDTYDQKFSMEGGLAGSVNTVSVKLLEQTGIGNTMRIAERMGIRSELPKVPSLALGTASISVMEMVSAYAVFANQGRHVPPIYITAVADNQGKVLETFSHADQPVSAVSKETSAMMIHMLRRVINEGTGSSLRSRFRLTNDMAGKTGTTQSNTDGWFIAITPKLVVGCWVGSDDPRLHFTSTALGQGATTALPIVGRFFQLVSQDKQFSAISNASFGPLTPAQMKKLDCELSKSDRNFLDRLFNRKKGTARTEYQEDKQHAKRDRQQRREERKARKKRN